MPSAASCSPRCTTSTSSSSPSSSARHRRCSSAWASAPRPLWRRATARYDSGRPSRRPARVSRPTTRSSTRCVRCTSAGSPPRCRRRRRSPSSPTTCDSQTPYRASDSRAARDPPPQLRRPAAGDIDRAPRLPDAVVARHVRARAVEAVGHLPRRAARRAAGRLPGLLALRHGLARDEHRRGRPAAAPGDRQRAARAAVRARRPPRRAVHARGPDVEPAGDGPVRRLRLPRRGGAARLLPRQPRGRPDHVARGRGRRGRARVGRGRRAGRAARRRVILGVETSCDDTCAAVVTRAGELRSNVIASQGLLHARYGGVVPEIASRRHLELLDAVIDDALERAGASLDDVDLVAVTRGPGLIGALLVGLSEAKALAAVRRLPLAPVDHLHGHVLASTLGERPIEAPFLCLVASGGHTFVARVDEPGPYTVLGQTLDDAAGEAFDKGGRLLGLPYPGGPEIDRLAREGDPAGFDFPRSLPGDGLDFSFSGLKTALLYRVRDLGEDETRRRRADLAASYQRAIVDALVTRARQAVEREGGRRLAIGGGVAANSELRARIAEACDELGVELWVPPTSLCTDNAAMIAGAARFTRALEYPDYLTLDASARVA